MSQNLIFLQDEVEIAEKALKPLPGSFMEFFKNGKSQGRAWENQIYSGEYYPCVSMYKSASVSVNFGPKFKYPPKFNQPYKAVHCRAYDDIVESCVADLLYAVELEVNGER